MVVDRFVVHGFPAPVRDCHALREEIVPHS